ncbi:heavy-metal-associated domain-containing protein [Halocatena pleomorpha]|uniref:Heavy-metal-associated domain-containing protein n=1 Tax=Halocatena pleomorpha TaxID=1785090 RepID=A0A3P3RDC4_9EURY|nr:cation transporter [Halocatena pleomorpha]RRJ31507.1 heavy-metal-associated domain-containing protein [Halocatena pleomorpha]
MTTTIDVEGMSCEHCEQTVEKALCDVTDVVSANAKHETETVTVEGTVDTTVLVQAIEDVGYTANA